MYRITKLFTGGNLEGLTHTEVTSVKFLVGDAGGGGGAGSPYRITSVTLVEDSVARADRAQELAALGHHDDAYLVSAGLAD